MTVTIQHWRSHLAAMDHAKGTTNKMIQAAMQQELAEWRRATAPLSTDLARAFKEQAESKKLIAALRSELRDERRLRKTKERVLETTRKLYADWRATALRYRKNLIEKNTEQKL